MIALRPVIAVLFSILLTLLPVFLTPAETDTTSISSWFTSNDIAMGDTLGARMSMSGDTVVIGHPRDSQDAPESGSAYVFVKDGSGWVQQQKLLPTTPLFLQSFGISAAIDGNTIVVGCPGEGEPALASAGAAYVFVRDGSNWVLQQKLLLPVPDSGDGFGGAVAIDGNSIVVTAMGDGEEHFGGTGSASVFTRDENGVWSFQQKLFASVFIRDRMYGGSVAISGDSVMVGSEYIAEPHGAGIGSVYLYQRVGNVWSEIRQLTSSTWKGGYEFGRFLAMDGDIAVIGAYNEEHGSNTRGSVYVFVRDRGEWKQQQKLFIKEDFNERDRFGAAVAIHGTTIVAGDFGDNEERGAVYVFTADGKLNWSQQTKFVASDGFVQDRFGGSVATNGLDVLTGAPLKNISSGAVYYTALTAP